MSIQQKEELKKMIEEIAVDVNGKMKIPCKKAFALSKEKDVSLKIIGDVCNEQNIRIGQCQLGCFQ